MQWFAGMDAVPGWQGVTPPETLRRTALRGVEATQFFPAWGQARLYGMIANRPDWTLSRQRQWGVPMPFFIHNEHYGALKVGPVIPLVNERSVLVAEEDFERASELLAAPPLPPEARTRRGRPGPGSVLRMLVEVVLLGWLIPGGRGRRGAGRRRPTCRGSSVQDDRADHEKE